VPLNLDIIASGLLALAVWGLIWRRSIQGPLGWGSPTALFAAGILALYVVPSLYWQFRPWPYMIPPYFEGIPLVLLGAFLLGCPFLFYDLVKPGPSRPRALRVAVRPGDFNWMLWGLVIPVLLGMGLRIYLLSIGWQSRFTQEPVSESSLLYLIENFVTYYPGCYFGLVAFGNRNQARVGKAMWVLDGCLKFWSLHRFEMLLFVLYSLIFLSLQGWRAKRKHIVFACGIVVFIIAVIGQTPPFADEALSYHRSYLGPLETLRVVEKTFSSVAQGGNLGRNWGQLTTPALTATDNTMFRLYDARSAAAVMSQVPKDIPYFHGETFLNILYAYIPRYFWKAKPDLREINLVTTWVMRKDSGVNPSGTLAEFYMNFGFAGIFLGGIICLVLCRWGENSLNTRRGIGPALYCVYPLLSLYFIWASETFSRRVSEGLRTLLVIGLLALVFHLAARYQRRMSRNRPRQVLASASAFFPVPRRPG
jgi:hypothetical protein